jgi:tryptophan-rich sensory protein
MDDLGPPVRERARSDTRGWLALAGWILLALLAGAIGSLASLNAPGFYETLAKPAWAPPAWLFGPVWTTLYALMGVAAWLVWRTPPSVGHAVAAARRRGLVVFIIQLVLNALWTWIFFRWRAGLWAVVEILVLWLAIAWLAVLFGRVRAAAAWLLAPYLVWVTYAAALTVALWRANGSRL